MKDGIMHTSHIMGLEKSNKVELRQSLQNLASLVKKKKHA